MNEDVFDWSTARTERLDDRYFIAWHVGDHMAEFRVVRCYGEVTWPERKYLYWADFRPTAFPHEADIFMSGFVKWDGCSNWSIGNCTVMTHFCGFPEATSLGRLMARMYRIAESDLDSFESDCADMPKLTEGK